MRKRVLVLPGMFLWMALVGIPSISPAQEVKTEETQPTGTRSAEVETIEPMVVTATRVEEPVSQTTKSISVVTTEERNQEQQYYLPELLDQEPGVFTYRTGGPGRFSTVGIRGAGPQHTQFQYNGFPLRDAADTQSTLQYFIEDLYSGSNLKQVEVLKGTQSTLYGSQAMGGVVNIVPEKWKKGFGFEWRNEMGAYNTFMENGRMFYGQDRFYLDFNPLLVHSDGTRNGGSDDYFYDNMGYTAGGGVKLGPGMALEFSSILYDSDLALDKVSPGLDVKGNLVRNLADPDKHREGLLQQHGMSFTHEVTPLWDYKLKGAYTGTERHYFWSTAQGDRSNYDGSTYYLEMQNNIHPTSWLTLVVGADMEQSNYDGREPRDPSSGNYTPVEFEQDWLAWDLFGEANFKFLDDSLLFSAGGRYNHHEEFDSKVVGEFSAAYIFKPWGTKIHGHVGTGYRTPSLYEIYGGYLFMGHLITIGNPDLEPEESTGYEVGIEQSLCKDKLSAGFTWFHTDFDDLIIYDGFQNKYMNASEAKTEGIETYLKYAPFKWLQLRAAYTYADSAYKEKGSGRWQQREYFPPHKVDLSAAIKPLEGLTAALRANWLDTKVVPLYDPAWNQVRWHEPGRWTVDAALTYKFPKGWEVWVRAENLLDTDYTEGSYSMPGQWFYGGFKYTF